MVIVICVILQPLEQPLHNKELYLRLNVSDMYIEKIKSPADLKMLDLNALKTVADETRQAVLNRVSKHGGHVDPISDS